MCLSSKSSSKTHNGFSLAWLEPQCDIPVGQGWPCAFGCAHHTDYMLGRGHPMVKSGCCFPEQKEWRLDKRSSGLLSTHPGHLYQPESSRASEPTDANKRRHRVLEAKSHDTLFSSWRITKASVVTESKFKGLRTRRPNGAIPSPQLKAESQWHC